MNKGMNESANQAMNLKSKHFSKKKKIYLNNRDIKQKCNDELSPEIN